MNAPQFGAAVNGPATPATNFLPFNFLPANSTNSAIPDFKTIAAPFFAPPATTMAASAAVETKSTTGAKSVGPFLPRERENDKEKATQDSALPATFLPSTPVYPFPILTPQAPKHAEPMTPQQQTDTKGNSSVPGCTLPPGNPEQSFDSSVSQSVTHPTAPNVPFLPLQQTLKNVGPKKAVVEPVRLDDVKNADAEEATTTKKATPSQTFPESQVSADSAPLNKIDNVGTDEGTHEATKTEIKTKVQNRAPIFHNTDATQANAEIAANLAKTSPITTTKENTPSVANNKATHLNTTGIDTRQTDATAFREKLSSKIEKTTDPAENKKSVQAKQAIEAAKNDSAETKPTDSITTADQMPQQDPPTQPIDEVIKAVIPQAVVLEHHVNGSVLGHATNPRPIQSAKSIANKSNQEETNSAQVNLTAPATAEKASTEDVKPANVTPLVEPNPKTVASKTKPDTTVKKSQKASAENLSDSPTATAVLHRPEAHVASSSQNVTASKNHDTVTPQLNIGAHTRPASAKNAPASSDPASPNATQVPDVDDITPPAHMGVNTAKLVQGLTQSELRVGLQTRDFGNIDIRTSASHHEFSAQISVEHSEVAHTLTSELPNLYARLSEQQVPVANIHIHNQSFSTSSGLDQRSQQSTQQSQSNGFMKQQSEPALPPVHEMFSSTDRLDIRV